MHGAFGGYTQPAAAAAAAAAAAPAATPVAFDPVSLAALQSLGAKAADEMKDSGDDDDDDK